MSCPTRRFNAMSAVCPSREVLSYVADKWTVLILAVLTEDTTRFNELRRRVQGITQKVLTQTLRDLERMGFVARRIYAEVPPRVEYSLTPLGRSLVKVLDGIREWADTHTGDVLAAQQRFERQAAAKAQAQMRKKTPRRSSATATIHQASVKARA